MSLTGCIKDVFQTDSVHTDRCSYLSSGLQAAGKLDLVDAMVHGLAVGGTLGDRAFTSTAAHTDTVDYVTC